MYTTNPKKICKGMRKNPCAFALSSSFRNKKAARSVFAPRRFFRRLFRRRLLRGTLLHFPHCAAQLFQYFRRKFRHALQRRRAVGSDHADVLLIDDEKTGPA